MYSYYHIKAKHFTAISLQVCIAVLQSDFENDDLLDGYPVEDGLSQLLLNELDHFKVSLSTQELRTPIVKRYTNLCALLS